MERRKALQSMGASLGFVIGAPALLTIMQGCEAKPGDTWSPQLLSQDAGHLLKQIVDAIIPKSDTLSASEVNVHMFIDSYAAEVMTEDEQQKLLATIEKIGDESLLQSGKKSIQALLSEDMSSSIIAALKGDINLPYTKRLRNLTIWGYKCTEYVGEEVMAYLPIPGQWVPCGDLQELTGGKVWSI